MEDRGWRIAEALVTKAATMLDHPSSILHPRSSILDHPSSILHPRSSILYFPSFIIALMSRKLTMSSPKEKLP